MALTAMLAPFVLVGAWLGTTIVGRASQEAFDRLALAASVVAAVALFAA